MFVLVELVAAIPPLLLISGKDMTNQAFQMYARQVLNTYIHQAVVSFLLTLKPTPTLLYTHVLRDQGRRRLSVNRPEIFFHRLKSWRDKFHLTKVIHYKMEFSWSKFHRRKLF